MLNRVPMMDLELKENDLISFMNPVCPQCNSKNVVKNGTCFRMQRYICSDCRYSFVARPPNYGYGKHFSHDMQNKSMKSRVKTSLRKAASLFRIINDTIISHETVRRLVPPLERSMMKSSGYFVYDEQYVHIDCVVKYRSVLKDSKTGNFVEEIPDDLQESTLTGFFIRSIGMFNGSMYQGIYS